jgi:hypothetical protein
MPGYVVQVADQSIGGKAPKWIIQGPGGADDFYIAKLGATNGHIEVLTELFNNLLGDALGFDIAHHGVAKLDSQLYFVTQNFRNSEALIHGSLLVADVLASDPKDLDQIAHRSEQEFYSVDFIRDAISKFCGDSADSVFQSFVNMLMFDSLIGSQDRHAKNWGVLRPETEIVPKRAFRLAPLFDSARALLWDMPEGKLVSLDLDGVAMDRYIAKSKPCIGPPRSELKCNKCNHLELMSSLIATFPHQTSKAHGNVADQDVVGIAKNILNEFPFARRFSGIRKRVILKVLARRVEELAALFGKERQCLEHN